MIFVDKLNAAVAKNKSLVCVGLDTDPELIPSGMSMLDFNKAIIDVTADLVCAFKPNIAFYEAQGEKGLDTLHKTIKHIPTDIPVIFIEIGLYVGFFLIDKVFRAFFNSDVIKRAKKVGIGEIDAII